MSVEVKYLYSRVDKKAVEIINIGGPHMYVPGVSSLSVSGGSYNIENNTTDARISRTCTLSYEVSFSLGISVGGDIFSIDKTESGTYIVTTNAITFVMNIRLGDLT